MRNGAKVDDFSSAPMQTHQKNGKQIIITTLQIAS